MTTWSHTFRGWLRPGSEPMSPGKSSGCFLSIRHQLRGNRRGRALGPNSNSARAASSLARTNICTQQLSLDGLLQKIPPDPYLGWGHWHTDAITSPRATWNQSFTGWLPISRDQSIQHNKTQEQLKSLIGPVYFTNTFLIKYFAANTFPPLNGLASCSNY